MNVLVFVELGWKFWRREGLDELKGPCHCSNRTTSCVAVGCCPYAIVTLKHRKMLMSCVERVAILSACCEKFWIIGCITCSFVTILNFGQRGVLQWLSLTLQPAVSCANDGLCDVNSFTIWRIDPPSKAMQGMDLGTGLTTSDSGWEHWGIYPSRIAAGFDHNWLTVYPSGTLRKPIQKSSSRTSLLSSQWHASLESTPQ